MDTDFPFNKILFEGMKNPLAYDELDINYHQIFFNENIENAQNQETSGIVVPPQEIEVINRENMQLRVMAGEYTDLNIKIDNDNKTNPNLNQKTETSRSTSSSKAKMGGTVVVGCVNGAEVLYLNEG